MCHGFNKLNLVKNSDGGLVLSSRQFSLLNSAASKMTVVSKMVKID